MHRRPSADHVLLTMRPRRHMHLRFPTGRSLTRTVKYARKCILKVVKESHNLIQHISHISNLCHPVIPVPHPRRCGADRAGPPPARSDAGLSC